MKQPGDSTRLFSTFQPVAKQEWLEAASYELKGNNPMEALRWNSGEIDGLPYYDAADTQKLEHLEEFRLQPSLHYLGPRAWYNMPIINVLYAQHANQQALHALQAGADGIVFQCHDSLSFDVLLSGIEGQHCQLAFILNSQNALDSLLKVINAHRPIQGFLLFKTYPQHPQSLHKLIHTLDEKILFRCLGVTSSEAHPEDQIADALSIAVNRAESLIGDKISVEKALRSVFFSMDIGADFFMELIKLKVLRALWYQAVQAYGVASYAISDVFIHARSNAWRKPELEPHENMLKATTASIAAITGGCDVLSVDPSDMNDDRQVRIARNISLILREESHLNKVADPTAGAYYLDSVFHTMASAAWKKFQIKMQDQ